MNLGKLHASDRIPLVLGANGMLGSSIVKQLKIPSKNLISRDMYLNWGETTTKRSILESLSGFDLSKADFFVATGITDPRLDSKLLWGLNYHLPRNLINATINSGSRVITFGTIHENFSIDNEYFASKRALGDFFKNFGTANNKHFLLHTLYNNDVPPEHMFLGQMFRSLKADTSFSMSNGEQLREFHHVDDIAIAVLKLLQGAEKSYLDVSAGFGIQISELAQEIFKAFGLLDRLQLGVFPSPIGDNFDIVFNMTNGLARDDFRDPIVEIPRVFKRLLGLR